MCNETVRHPNITALWHVPPALFASLVLLMAATKKGENGLEDEALLAGTQQNLSNLYSKDIYERN
jgi:hypothetical protein